MLFLHSSTSVAIYLAISITTFLRGMSAAPIDARTVDTTAQNDLTYLRNIPTIHLAFTSHYRPTGHIDVLLDGQRYSVTNSHCAPPPFSDMDILSDADSEPGTYHCTSVQADVVTVFGQGTCWLASKGTSVIRVTAGTRGRVSLEFPVRHSFDGVCCAFEPEDVERCRSLMSESVW